MPLRLWRRDDGRSSNWYIIGTVPVWRDGRMRKERIKPRTTGTADRLEAEGILLQVAGSYQRGNIENRDPTQTFSHLVKPYLDAGKSDRYLIRVVSAIGDTAVDALTQALIDAEALKAYPDAQPATRRRQWHGVINAVLRHSHPKHPGFVLPEASAQKTHWVTPAKADEIIRQCAAGRYKDPWAPAAAELLFGTGARAGEVMDLDTVDLNLEHGFVIYRDTKNDTERLVPLLPRTIAALSRLPNLGTPGKVIKKAGGEDYEERKDNRGHKLHFLRAAAKRAGVEPFNPHMTRHSFATWFYNETKDALRLKQVGGWNTDTAMQRYTHLVPASVGHEAIKLGWDFRERAIETPADEERKQA